MDSLVSGYITDYMDEVMRSYLCSDEHTSDNAAITKKEHELYSRLPEELKDEFLEYVNLVSNVNGKVTRAAYHAAFAEGVAFRKEAFPDSGKHLTEPQS